MHILRKLALWSSSVLFSFFLMMAALVSTIVIVLGTPTHIKEILKTSNVYSTVVDSVLKQAQKSSEQSTSDDLPINDPTIQQAAKTAFSPVLLQNSTEQIIDGTYHWLNSKTTKPDFRVDLTGAKQSFIQTVADYAEQRVAALPICTKLQLQSLQSQTGYINPFTATCRPAYLQVAQQKQKIINDLSTSKDFLANPVITADTFTKDKNGQTIFDKTNEARKVYRLTNLSPWLLGVLILLFGAAVVFLHDTRRRGLHNIGASLISIGVVIGGSSLLATWLFHKTIAPTGSIGKSLVGNSFQQSVVNALNSLGQLINTRLLCFGISYAAIGVLVLALLFYPRPKKELEPLAHKTGEHTEDQNHPSDKS